MVRVRALLVNHSSKGTSEIPASGATSAGTDVLRSQQEFRAATVGFGGFGP